LYVNGYENYVLFHFPSALTLHSVSSDRLLPYD